MFYQVAAVARDISIILLVLEAMVLFAVPLFILLKITQGLRKLKPSIKPFFQKVRDYFVLANRWSNTVSYWIAKPFVWVPSTRRGIQVSVAEVKRSFSKES